MAELGTRDKPIASPRQLLVVGVLGVVLATVLVGQFGGASGKPGDVEGGKSPRGPLPTTDQAGNRKPSTASAARSSQATSTQPAPEAWRKLSAEIAGQYDPFAVPEPLARKITESRPAAEDRKSGKSAAKRDASAEKMAALKSKGITVIVRTNRGAVAMIGNRVVRVGDELEGCRVVSIDLQGIELAPADRQESHEVHK
jgi:hypothetical protein